MNDLAPIKTVLGVARQIKLPTRGKIHVFVFVCITGWVG